MLCEILRYFVITACIFTCHVRKIESGSTVDGPFFGTNLPVRFDFSNGTGGKLECSAVGSPLPTVVWSLLDGTLVSNVSGLRQVTSDGSLIFLPFRAEQFRPDIHIIGYRCVASNLAGTIISHDIHVKAVLSVEYDVHVYDEFAIRGNTAAVKCHVPSFLRDYVSVVSWIRDDTLKVIASMDTDGKFWLAPHGELYIKDVGASDKGSSYRCQTFHRLTGEMRTSTTVGRLIITEPRGNIPPKIVDGNTVVTVMASEVAFLPCVAQGYPRPTISWFRKTEAAGDVPLALSRAKIINQGLLLHDTNHADNGVYVCQVNSSTWTTTREIKLHVIEPLEVKLKPSKQTLNVGQTLSLACEVTGGPDAQISWFKDGQAVTKSPVKIGHKGSASDLHLALLKSEDKGMYQCFVRVGDSVAHSAAQVSLGDYHPELQSVFEGSTVDPGSSVTLTCSAVGNPDPEIAWLLDGTDIQWDGQRVVVDSRVDNEGVKHGTLHVERSRVEDGGLYSCEASNRLGKMRHDARVNIYGPLGVRKLDTVTVVAGENAVLNCPVYGYPIDKIEWHKESRILPSSVRQEVFHNGTLIIRSVRRNLDSGKYVCTAINANGKSVEATLQVAVMVPPKILPFTFQDELLREGMRARLQCVVGEGDSPVRIEWLKDGDPLDAESGVVVQSIDEFSSILAIKVVMPRHNGLYTCLARNAAGVASHSAQLSVNAPPKIIPFAFQDDQNFKGMRAHITCTVSQGDLPITFWWLKDSLPVQPSSDVKVTSYDRHSSALSIESVAAVHSGNYTCLARNLAGEAGFTAQLLVQVRPKILPFAFQDEKFSVGGNIVVVCMLTEGDPPLTFIWTKDGMPIETISGISAVTASDFNSVLTVKSATPSHSGNYTCSVTNSAAAVEFTAELNVNVAPKIVPFSFGGDHYFVGVLVRVSCVVYQGDLPLNIHWLKDGLPIVPNAGVSIQSMDDFTSVLTIDNIQSQHSGNYTCVARNTAAAASHSAQLVVKVPPKIVPFSFQDEQLVAGMFVRVSCVVSRGDLPLDITWLKDGFPIAPLLNVSTRKFDEYSSVLSIDSLNFHHNGNYTCRASNSAATATFMAPLIVNVPPRWIVKPNYKIAAVLGSDVVLHCQAEGFPKPSITWLKDRDSTLLGSSTVVFPNGTLFMTSITEDLEGYYVCKANNGIGEGLDEIVHVKVYDPPVIVFKSNNRTVDRESTALLSCVSKGDPPLNITWSVNGKTLGPKLMNRYKIKEDQAPSGLSSELTIVKIAREDSQLYTCTARNAYGEARAVMKLVVQSQPDPPIGVTVNDVGNQAVKVSWKPPFDGNSPVLKYIIEYRQKGGTAHNKTVHGGQQIATVSGLQPSAMYYFRMFAENAFGQSLWTELVDVVLAGEVPSGFPRSVEVQALDSQTVKVSWQPPARNTWNGDIRGYHVGYREAASANQYEFQLLEVPVGYDKGLSFTIPDLKEFTKYAIVVQAFNDIGKGPLSPEILVMTNEDVPSKPPTSVTCSSQSANKILVRWKPPSLDSVNGILRGYRVLYWPVDSWDGRHIGVENSSDSAATLSNLTLFTNYSIQVVAYTLAGDGTPGRPVYCRTMEDVPDSLNDVKCVPASTESVVVFWMPPHHVNGYITHYTVYVEDPSNGWRAKHKVLGQLSNHEVQSLKRSLRYKFWVTASSVLGEGKPSQVVYCGPAASFVLPKCVTFSQVFKATQGTKVSLPCPTVGVPMPQFVWLHGKQEVSVKDLLQVLQDKSLVIDKIQSVDAGNYTCQVKNDYGDDQVSHIVIVQVPPASPTLSVIMATFNSIGLRWKPRANGDSPIQGFVLRYKSEIGSWETVELQPYQDSYTLRNLKCGTTYDMTISALNEVGTGENSDILSVSTDGGVPVAPSVAELIEGSTTHVTVHLDSWVTNGCPILYFTVEYKLRHAVMWTLAAKGVRPNQRMLVVADLIAESWYTLRMTAHSTPGTTIVEYDFATLADNKVRNFKKEITTALSYTDFASMGPLIACAFVIVVCLVGTCIWVRRRRQELEAKAGKDRNIAREDHQNTPTRSTLASLRTSAGGHADGADSDDGDISPYAMVRLSDFQPGTSKSAGHASGSGSARHSVPSWQHTPPPGMFVHHQPTAPPMSESYGPGGVYPPGLMMAVPGKGSVPHIQGYAQPLKGNKKPGSGTHPPRGQIQGSGASSETTFVFPPAPDGDYDPPPEFKWPFTKQ